MIKVLSFDLDDTLWDNHQAIARAKQKLYNHLVEQYPQISTLYDQKAFEDLGWAIIQANPNNPNIASLKQQQIEKVLAQFDIPLQAADYFFDYYYEWRNRVELFPEVISCLNALKSNYQLVSATNGNINLKSIGLDHFFDYSVCAADVQAKKPDQKIYQSILKKLKVDAEQVIHIGDSFENDVLGSLHCGMKALWYNPNRLAQPMIPTDFSTQYLGSISHHAQIAEMMKYIQHL